MDQPTDKVIIRTDDKEELKEMFGRLAPGDSVSVTSATLTVDEIVDGVAVLSIDEIAISESVEPMEDEEIAEGEDGSAAMAAMSEAADEEDGAP